eukprot:GHUV01024984.1.p2 GENE.GHUV01024984.1~~GHUV01024984.1.p2  ORF type:complete len:105 (-),score=24.48 GHUV01024984.1:431-745(-)
MNRSVPPATGHVGPSTMHQMGHQQGTNMSYVMQATLQNRMWGACCSNAKPTACQQTLACILSGSLSPAAAAVLLSASLAACWVQQVASLLLLVAALEGLCRHES